MRFFIYIEDLLEPVQSVNTVLVLEKILGTIFDYRTNPATANDDLLETENRKVKLRDSVLKNKMQEALDCVVSEVETDECLIEVVDDFRSLEELILASVPELPKMKNVEWRLTPSVLEIAGDANRYNGTHINRKNRARTQSKPFDVPKRTRTSTQPRRTFQRRSRQSLL